jgi:hypothetical protein
MKTRTNPGGFIAALLTLSLCCPAPTQAGPNALIRVPHDLFDQSRPDTLGLEPAPGAETITVFRPGAADGAYNHGVVLMPFKGSLYAQWQNSARDEDSPDTRVLYSVSAEGKEWSRPRPLVNDPTIDAHSNGGWWTDGETLVAYIVRWKHAERAVRSGDTVFSSSTDGVSWTRPAPVSDQHGKAIDGVIEQDPHRLPGSRIIGAFHEQPGLKLAPFYTDNPLATSGWTRGLMQNLPFDADTSRELEPSWFLRPDGAIVMIMRDQASSFRKLASISTDNGETWSKPVVTGVPDSRSKQSAGNLPNGTAYMVGNPTDSKQRFPLVLMLSRDGMLFDRALLLRSGGADLQAMHSEGRYKRAGYSYPKSIIWNGYLYVGYATNKEDVELTRVPMQALTY